jgi:hypothetical protein
MRFPELGITGDVSDDGVATLKRMVSTGLNIVNKEGNFYLGKDSVDAVTVYELIAGYMISMSEVFQTSAEYAITARGRRVAEVG